MVCKMAKKPDEKGVFSIILWLNKLSFVIKERITGLLGVQNLQDFWAIQKQFLPLYIELRNKRYL